MKVTPHKVIQITKVEFNRGFIEETRSREFSRLVIVAESKNYDFTNWGDVDLLDLSAAIKVFVELKNQEALPTNPTS